MKRPPREWAGRAVLAVLLAAIGYLSVTFSLAQVVASRNAALADRLAPYDGRHAALLAAARLPSAANDADRRSLDGLARRALRHDPTAVAAVSTLGLNAQVRGDTPLARRYFAFAQTLSRRNLQTQLWAIEDAVAREDIPAALRHYDIALRTKRDVSELLFPVLASASSDPVIRRELTRTLAQRPLWGEAFINYAAESGKDPNATAALFADLRRARVPVSQVARARAVNAMIGENLIDRAWAYYSDGTPGMDRRLTRDPNFEAKIEIPSVLDWSPVVDGAVVTSIQNGEGGGVFDFTAPPGAAGPVLRQVQLFPPGKYILSGRSGGIEQSERSRPYWLLTCLDGRELGRLVMPNSNTDGGRFAGQFRVPTGCPVQALTFVVRPSDSTAEITGQIFNVQMRPDDD